MERGTPCCPRRARRGQPRIVPPRRVTSARPSAGLITALKYSDLGRKARRLRSHHKPPTGESSDVDRVADALLGRHPSNEAQVLPGRLGQRRRMEGQAVVDEGPLLRRLNSGLAPADRHQGAPATVDGTARPRQVKPPVKRGDNRDLALDPRAPGSSDRDERG